MGPRQPGLLRRRSAFRRLWLARSSSYVGDGIALVALLLYVEEGEGTGVAVGALLLAGSVPRFLGPLAGILADRVERRRLMVVCDCSQAALFAAIAALEPGLPALLALVVSATVFATAFQPASASAVAALVEPDELLQANAWQGTALNLQVAAGPFLGGALVAGLGTRGALAANALTFLVSAGLVMRLPPLYPSGAAARQGFLAVGREGVAFVWRSPLLRAVVLTLFLGVAFAALDNVALVFLVRQTLDGGALAFGLVSGAYGVGMVVASVALSLRPASVAAIALFLLGWLASGAGTLLTGVAPVVAVAALTQALAGAGNGLENIAGNTIVQQEVPRHMLGRVFGLVGSAAFGGGTVAYALGGFLLDATSPRTVFLVAGAGTLGVLVLLLAAVRLARRGTRT